MIVATLAAACDIDDTQHVQKTIGPKVSVVGTNLGTNGDPPVAVPADGVLQISFDRYLLPSTITRQSYAVLDSNSQPLGNLTLQTIYDPIARIVTIAGPEGPGMPWLVPDQTYHLRLPVPPNDGTDLGGFRAIDRATLAAPLDFTFRAGPPDGRTTLEPPVDFCGDILPLFFAKCSGCHAASNDPTAALVLETSLGVAQTAKDRVAQGSNTTHSATEQGTSTRVFGLNMPIIKSKDPGSSWLLYKVDLAPYPVLPGGGTQDYVCNSADPNAPPPPPKSADYVPLVRFQPSADGIDREILSDYVLGREMPYPSPPGKYIPKTGESTYVFTPLTFQEREKIRIWIEHDAPIRECGGCFERP